jgi:uroporphyrinogen decarboxylase
MTSRERFILAANHKEADRVPIDFGTTRSGGITAIAYNDLKRHLKMDVDGTRVYDIQQQLAWPDESLMQDYGIDFFDVGRAFLDEPGYWKPCRLKDGSSALLPAYHKHSVEPNGDEHLCSKQGTLVAVKPTSSLYFDQVSWPWSAMDSIPDPIPTKDFHEEIWDVPASPNHLDYRGNPADWDRLASTVRMLHETSTRALYICMGRPGLFENGWYMRGAENWFMDLASDKAGVCRMLDAFVEDCLEQLERMLTAIGKYVQVVRLFHDDIGNQNGPQFDPQLFKEIMMPRYKRLTDFIHSKTQAKVLNHSCGSIFEFIPFFIESGIDMLNPIQTSCSGMDPQQIKKEFGKDLVLWGGGIDTVNELTNGTPHEVKEQVRRRMDVLAKDGGFVFVQTHNIQPGVPAENVVAMLEAANEFGVYR